MIKRKSYNFFINFKIGFIPFLLLINYSLKAQLLSETELKNATIYSLEEALQKDPLKVYAISLKRSKLTVIPEEIYQFKNLNSLILKNNKLSEFPKKVIEFKYLQVLDISSNKITTIPKELGNLTNLNKLYLHQNKFTSIPHQIKYLKRLTHLTLSGSKITNLPIHIRELNQTLTRIEMWQVPISLKSYRKIKLLLPNTTIKYSQFCNCD